MTILTSRGATSTTACVSSGSVVLPTHLLLGATAAEMAMATAAEMAEAYSRAQLEESAAWSDASRSADFGAGYPIPLPTERPA